MAAKGDSTYNETAIGGLISVVNRTVVEVSEAIDVMEKLLNDEKENNSLVGQNQVELCNAIEKLLDGYANVRKGMEECSAISNKILLKAMEKAREQAAQAAQQATASEETAKKAGVYKE